MSIGPPSVQQRAVEVVLGVEADTELREFHTRLVHRFAIGFHPQVNLQGLNWFEAQLWLQPNHKVTERSIAFSLLIEQLKCVKQVEIFSRGKWALELFNLGLSQNLVFQGSDELTLFRWFLISRELGFIVLLVASSSRRLFWIAHPLIFIFRFVRRNRHGLISWSLLKSNRLRRNVIRLVRCSMGWELLVDAVEVWGEGEVSVLLCWHLTQFWEFGRRDLGQCLRELYSFHAWIISCLALLWSGKGEISFLFKRDVLGLLGSIVSLLLQRSVLLDWRDLLLSLVEATVWSYSSCFRAIFFGEGKLWNLERLPCWV